jgi:hypothetical protein
LSLYEFSNNDLKQFRKIGSFIEAKEVEILLPEQVHNEVYRRRETMINEVINRFEKQFKESKIHVPNICKEYENWPDLNKKIVDLQRLLQTLPQTFKNFTNMVRQDAINNKLHADVVIKEIFGKVNLLECTDEITARANSRFDAGNPPGKGKSYGDAINWETLLCNVSEGENLYFVGREKDYCSALDGGKFNPYLLNEWNKKKKSDVCFYKSLPAFINEHVQAIELESEYQKNELIDLLDKSDNFSRTHYIIKQLNFYRKWTPNQIVSLCKIANTNSQVYWIIGDPDIRGFYTAILNNYPNKDQADTDIEIMMNKLEELKQKDK